VVLPARRADKDVVERPLTSRTTATEKHRIKPLFSPRTRVTAAPVECGSLSVGRLGDTKRKDVGVPADR